MSGTRTHPDATHESRRRQTWRTSQKWLEMDEELVETPEYAEKREKEPEDDDRPLDS